MKFVKILTAALGSLVVAFSASADVVYENGAFDATFQGAQISPSQIVSNSFTLVSTTTLTRVTVGLWTPSNSSPMSLKWSIGSSVFGNEYATGATFLSSTPAMEYASFNVFLATFDLTVALPGGDFWLTLSDGVSTGGASLGWDINFGPSLAHYRNIADSGTVDSEYFKLEGSQVIDPGPSPVPEPASLAVFAIGLLCAAAARRCVTRAVRPVRLAKSPSCRVKTGLRYHAIRITCGFRSFEVP